MSLDIKDNQARIQLRFINKALFNMIKKNKKSLMISFLLLFTVVSLISCSTIKQQALKPAAFPTFSAESHRGGRGDMPENTIPAMLYSLSLDGITTLELDVHVTADKQLVLTHDNYINSLFTLKPDGTEIDKSENKNYPIYQMTYDEIKMFDVGSKVNKSFPEQKKMKLSIPLLENVIDSVQHYIKSHKRQQIFYNIETKSAEAGDNVLNPLPEEFIKLLMDVVNKKGITPYVIIQSADVRTLQVLNDKYPHVRTSYLVGARRKDYTVEEDIKILGFDPDIYSPNFKYITKEDVEKCHKRGMKVVVWTPNTKREIANLKAMGVDGIITDYPQLLVE